MRTSNNLGNEKSGPYYEVKPDLSKHRKSLSGVHKDLMDPGYLNAC